MEFLFFMEFFLKLELEDLLFIEVEFVMKVGSRISRGRMIRVVSISLLFVLKFFLGFFVIEVESRSGINILILIWDLNRYFRMLVFIWDLKKYLYNNLIFMYVRFMIIIVIFLWDLKYNLIFNILFLIIYIIIYMRFDFNILIFVIDLKKYFNVLIFIWDLKN